MKFPPLTLGAFLMTTQMMAAFDEATIGPKLDAIVREEMREWNLGGVALALVDDQEVVHAAGFGEATRDSVFRVGSISKLFNALAVMQQVEKGELDLDEPISKDLLPVNPFPDQPDVTLRQLLCHRSGLQREPTVGSYFDDSEPGLEATVKSAHEGVLVTRPGEKMRYSNLGPSLAGYLVEKASGESYEDYQKNHLLEPLGMSDSAWTLANVPEGRLIVSHMRVADGQGGWTRRETPVFDLGTIPAGNLYSTVDDLSRFVAALSAGGNPLIKGETLAEMWRPQLTEEETGFGLGFVIGKFREHRSISHSGAVYGHSSSLMLLPDEKLAVIVLGNEDIASGRIARISTSALSLFLEAKLDEKVPEQAAVVEPEDLSIFTGEYESQSYWAALEVRNGKLMGEVSGQPIWFNPTGPLTFVADSRIAHEAPVVFEKNEEGSISGFRLSGQTYQRASENAAPLPPHWRTYLGSYGPDYMPLVISERHGHLYVMTENMVDYRMTPVNRHVCALPPGMYVDEEVVFLTDTDGKIYGINFANMVFPRRS